MIYISDKEQTRIKRKIALLPEFMRSHRIGIIFFELIGVTIFSYGICMARYLHPIQQRKINHAFDFLISCIYYFALSAAAPFSGGHLNPAVTLAVSRLRKNIDIKIYAVAQILGALLGSGIAYVFFGVVPFFYWEEVSFSSLAIDTASEAFGTFVFVFFVLLTTETNYMAGEYFRYMLIAIMLLAGRIFTLRRGCLNPVIGVVFQLFAAIEKQNIMLLLYSLTLLIGPLLGGLIAVYFFRYGYAPLKQGLALQKMKLQDNQERFEDSEEQV